MNHFKATLTGQNTANYYLGAGHMDSVSTAFTEFMESMWHFVILIIDSRQYHS